MNTQYKVELARYHPAYLEVLKTFKLPKEQEQFTALPIEMLEVTDVRHPIVILSNNEPVGFFVLHSSDRVKEYTDNPRAMLLTAFSINHSQQGRGFAKQGMNRIKPFVMLEFPACNEIVLAVNHKNLAAQKLYEKVGFQDTLRRKIGSIGEQFVLSLPFCIAAANGGGNDMLVSEENRIQEYFKRIGMSGNIQVDYPSLHKIQTQHMLTVPFENMDIANGKPIKLDQETLFDKIVRRKRGGYCYELNGLLAWFLDRLGFKVTLLSGKVRRDDGTFGPDFDHMLLLVQLDKDYIVDVGFGQFARSPLPLSGEVISDISGSYRILSKPDSDVYFFQKCQDGEWVSGYEFTLNSRLMEDFKDMNEYQQTSPHSHFTQNLLVSMATPEGRLTIAGDSFMVTSKSDRRRKPIDSKEDRNELLERYFGIVIESC